MPPLSWELALEVKVHPCPPVGLAAVARKRAVKSRGAGPALVRELDLPLARPSAERKACHFVPLRVVSRSPDLRLGVLVRDHDFPFYEAPWLWPFLGICLQWLLHHLELRKNGFRNSELSWHPFQKAARARAEW